VLGAVTCAANTQRVQIITASGNSTTVVKRHSLATGAASRSGRGLDGGDAVVGPTAPLVAASAAAAAPVGTRRRGVKRVGTSADVLARAKRTRIATLAAVAARARDERVARRILDDAAAARLAADVATGARMAPVHDAGFYDDVGRALVAASARMRASSRQVSPRDRLAAMRERIAGKQQHAPGRGEL
jgi:hypothetical protein